MSNAISVTAISVTNIGHVLTDNPDHKISGKMSMPVVGFLLCLFWFEIMHFDQC